MFEDEISQELEQIASDSTDPILALKRIVSLQSNIEKLTKEDPYFFAKKVSKNDIFPGIDSCEKVCHTEEKVYDHEVILSPDDIKSVYRARERRTLLLLPGRSNNSLSIYLRSNNFLFHTKYHYWYSVDKKEDAMSIVNSIREMCSLPRHKF